MKNSKKNLLMIVAVVFVSLFLSLAGKTSAQSPDVENKLLETQKSVEDLLNLKDNSSLSDEEKAKAEILMRKDVVSKVIDLSTTQINDLKKKINAIDFGSSDEWKNIRESFVKKADEYLDYYKTISDSINSNKVFTLDDIKALAKSIEEKKAGEIDIEVGKINNVVVAFGISDVLKLADERLKKVSLDINKIYEKKLTQSQTLKDLYKKSSGLIDGAHLLNNKVKEVMLNVYSSVSDENNEKFLDDLKKEIANYYESLEMLSSKAPASVSENSTTTDELSNQTSVTHSVDQYIQDLSMKSLSNIKEAYGVFIDMSVNVKKYIK